MTKQEARLNCGSLWGVFSKILHFLQITVCKMNDEKLDPLFLIL